MNHKNFYKSPIGYGSYNVENLIATIKNMPDVEIKKGKWIKARPEPYYSFWERLRQAWDVLTYKADALYWGIRKTK
jgi:hypothetical protein